MDSLNVSRFEQNFRSSSSDSGNQSARSSNFFIVISRGESLHLSSEISEERSNNSGNSSNQNWNRLVI